MEEAKFSFNVKFNLNGFDSQLTVRTDTTGTECIELATRAITVLTLKGAVPDRRWEAVKNGNNQPKVKAGAVSGAWVAPDRNQGAEPKPEPRLCPICHEADKLNLITTRYGRRFKCQRCDKWLPRALQPTDEELAEMDSK